jgi:hypothetical protein
MPHPSADRWTARSLLAVPDTLDDKEPAGLAVLSGTVPDAAADHVSFPLTTTPAPQITVRLVR